MKIKESYHQSWKPGIVSASDGIWLDKAIRRPDAIGRRGIDFFDENDIKIVKKDEKADVGLSIHGDPVRGIPREKCILLKGEPPIYNIYFGWRLCKPNFLNKYMATISNTILENLEQVHFNSPQSCFEFIPSIFNKPKKGFLCMLLRNKIRTVDINRMSLIFAKWNKYSNHKYRVDMDKGFCDILGPDLYHSYGRGWCPSCFKGQIEGGTGEIIKYTDSGIFYTFPIPPELQLISNYKFNFCPENSIFNGYVTEKPVHAMACGSIPIYSGAPDRYKYLTKESFIDVTKFNNQKDLCDYIQGMDEKTYKGYREKMYNFVTTKESDNFSSYIFAKKIVKILEEHM